MAMEINHPGSLKHAIKAKCMECCCGQREEVRLCKIETCPIWPYRMGKNPFRKKRELTEEQRAAASERFAKARARKVTE